MADNNDNLPPFLPTPDPFAIINVLTTLVRFGVAMAVGGIMRALVNMGIDIDSKQVEGAVWWGLAMAYLFVARWLEEKGYLTRLLGIKAKPKYTKPPS